MADSDIPLSVTMAKRIELWSIDRLIPYENNARTHSTEQVAQIAASIAEFGFTNPILVDQNNGIIAGHGRFAAAKELGLPQVPVVMLDHLSKAQRRAYILADNKLALNAGWDADLLKLELRALEEEDDFGLDVIGFSEQELSDLLGSMEEDLEPIEAEGEEAKGTGMDYLVIGAYKIPLDADELNQLTSVVQAYADDHGTTLGFGSYLLRQIDK
jgi:ParB/RepB/Spo0J family partition protein